MSLPDLTQKWDINGKPNVFAVGARVALENLGYFSTGVVTGADCGDYYVKWDDGYEDEPGLGYDGYDLVPEEWIEPDLVDGIPSV